MDRKDFQKLAQMRLDEAKLLSGGGMYAGAYYLAGYAVECALKACIAKRTKAEEFPPIWTVVRDKFYTHSLQKLCSAAELTTELDGLVASDPVFDVNWATVARWSEESRYECRTEAEAKDLVSAIEVQSHGVLPWLQRHW